MTKIENILGSKRTPLINTFLFTSFCYLAYKPYDIDKMTPYFLISILGSIILTIYGLKAKFGRTYFFLAFLPILACLILAFLFFTGTGWYILALFGIFGYEPN